MQKSKNLCRTTLDEFYELIYTAAGDWTGRNPMQKAPAKTVTVKYDPRDANGGRRYRICAGCK